MVGAEPGGALSLACRGEAPTTGRTERWGRDIMTGTQRAIIALLTEHEWEVIPDRRQSDGGHVVHLRRKFKGGAGCVVAVQPDGKCTADVASKWAPFKDYVSAIAVIFEDARMDVQLIEMK